MPNRPCLTCGVLVRNASYCAAHSPKRDRAEQARFRRRLMKEYGGRCAACGTTEDLQAHHLYGRDDPRGVLVCRRHHKSLDRNAPWRAR